MPSTSKPRSRIEPATIGYKRRHYFEWAPNGVPTSLTGITVTAKGRKPWSGSGSPTYAAVSVTQLDQDLYPGQFYTEIASGVMDTASLNNGTENDWWWLDLYIDTEPVPHFFKFAAYAKETEAP